MPSDMKSDAIEALGIDGEAALWVKPQFARFPYIYREAMEIQWSEERGCLYSPRPREWSYVDWFRQIRKAAFAQGVNLKLNATTRWTNIPNDLRVAITADAGKSA